MGGCAEYVVLAKRSDCGDLAVFTIEDSFGRDHWPSFAQARAAMKADYEIMREEYSPDKTRDGKDVRVCKLDRSSAVFSVPIWDGERKRESMLKCKWKVVEI